MPRIGRELGDAVDYEQRGVQAHPVRRPVDEGEIPPDSKAISATWLIAADH
jgi:hypothetical protein